MTILPSDVKNGLFTLAVDNIDLMYGAVYDIDVVLSLNSSIEGKVILIEKISMNN